MSFLDTMKEKARGFIATTKAKFLVASVSLVGLVQYANAGSLNDSVGPILDSVISLFVPLLALIIAAVPLIIAISIIGFILGLLDGILKMLHI